MIGNILNWLFRCREIPNCDRDIYLRRWYVFKSKWFTIFIHQFVRSDEDRCLHDHPWSFLVIPIWRGYIEHNERECDCYTCQHDIIYGFCTESRNGIIPGSTRVLPILGTRLRPAKYRHRVELFKRDGKELPSWSLFIHFRKVRDWGFWLPEGFVQWQKFWQDKCE